MKLATARYIISFIGTYLIVAIILVMDKSPARDYLIGFFIALIVAFFQELIQNYFEQRRNRKNSR